ncbi:unnamed protein product, partial [marine sediment metagenome]
MATPVAATVLSSVVNTSRKVSSDIEERMPGKELTPYQPPAATYANEESWDIDWNEDGLPTKIVVHRNAART